MKPVAWPLRARTLAASSVPSGWGYSSSSRASRGGPGAAPAQHPHRRSKMQAAPAPQQGAGLKPRAAPSHGPNGAADDDTLELVEAAAAPRDTGLLKKLEDAKELGDWDRARSVAVQRELGKAMAAQKWPAVAANLDVPAMGGNVFAEARVRGQWLLGLLCLQSLSSVVLAAPANRQLINDHIVITLFLTMLVGAGGNAGNQSSILIIRGLATGQFQATWPSFRQALTQQGMVAGLLGTAMALGGYLRVYMTNENPQEAFAIAMSLFCIVISSVFAGTALPFALAWAKVDPAHAGTTIQVVMDVGGVAVTCLVCHILLSHYATVEAVAAASTAAAAAAGAG